MVVFFDYETIQTTTTVVDDVVQFPAVTFCNLMPFDLKKDSNLAIMLEFVQDNYPDIDNQLSITEMLDYFRAAVAYRLIAGTITDSFVESLGFDYSSVVISCHYNGKICSKKDFTWSYSYRYGNCFTFNKRRK